MLKFKVKKNDTSKRFFLFFLIINAFKPNKKREKTMTFDFERDHSDIHAKLTYEIEYKYLREFYLRFNTRGIYPSNLKNKTEYKSIEQTLNSNISLRTLCSNAILSSNDDTFITNSINSVPSDLYKTFLKCALYSLNDFAVDVNLSLISNSLALFSIFIKTKVFGE